MADSPSSVKDIFATAREIDDLDERRRYLDEVCVGDQALRAEVEELLRSIDRAGAFLGGSIHKPTVDLPVAERAGDAIGPYKLLQQIGEGGMGVVYMAEQTNPIERRVALKIIKPGMDTRQVIARFQAERQALAMMDHPNISQVFDAGVTDTGRPYFVMELVKGVAVTEYCDERQLTLRKRLELFLPICQAIQHAHQKGIIHRDIKPSNVLVAHYDDQPVPKIIDFGVAKAIDHRLTEKTMFTEYGQVLGTIEYMSPEQARFNQWDVDTRSDVYSLGVLLYELLSGETPFDRQRLRSAAFDELLRIIREEEPPRPSVRLSTSASLPSIAASRNTEPDKLSWVIHGELDWIVMKALEKDRTRRYETAAKFSDDVDNYLNNDTVEACPPSAGYRFRKFARRNTSILTALTAVAMALLLGTGVATWQAIRAIRAEALATERLQGLHTEREKALKAEQRAIASAEELALALRETQEDFEEYRLVSNLVKAYQTVGRFDGNVAIDREIGLRPETESLIWLDAGASLIKSGDYEAFDQLCVGMEKRFQHTTNAEAAERTCKLCCLRPGTDRTFLPRDALDNAIADRRTPGFVMPWLQMTRAMVYFRDGDFQMAMRHARSSQTIEEAVLPHLGRDAATALNYTLLAMSMHQQGDRKQAKEMLQVAVKALGRLPDEENRILVDKVFAEVLIEEAQAVIASTSQ